MFTRSNRIPLQGYLEWVIPETKDRIFFLEDTAVKTFMGQKFQNRSSWNFIVQQIAFFSRQNWIKRADWSKFWSIEQNVQILDDLGILKKNIFKLQNSQKNEFLEGSASECWRGKCFDSFPNPQCSTVRFRIQTVKSKIPENHF